jgi:NAD(P)-dependent dehydrogenase (short-subunit alcohol dehydrogenase family)
MESMGQRSDLDGHSVLITGAGRRLGKAFTMALATCGADVVVHYGRSAEEAEETARAAQGKGVRALAIQADLAAIDQVISLFERAVDALGKIDLLVNNASIFESVNFEETTLDDWERHIAINLTAPFVLSQSFARHHRGESGVIVNMLDWRALRPGPDHFPYTITKAALTRSLAQSLAPDIRVNGLALGAILPPPGTKEYDSNIIEDVPVGRWGTVDEAVNALLFLLTGPDFITGEILHLDGGRHLT